MLTVRDLVIPVYKPDSAAADAASLLRVESARHRQHVGLPAGSVRGHRSGSEATAPAAWLGSADALAELGLTAELDVSLDRLALALQGRHVRSRESVRRHGSTAVIQVALTLRIPQRVTDRWRESGPEQRAMIERALLRSAETAIAHMVLDRKVAQAWPGGRLVREAPVGFAAVAAVHGTREPTRPVMEPTVRAVLLGVQRADRQLVRVDPREMHRAYLRDEAERVAWRALADEPSLRYSGRQAVAAVRAFERPPAPAEASPRPGIPRRDPLEGWRKLVGDRRAERVGARADELGERMATLPYVELVAERQALKAEFTPRDRAAARRALSLERDLDGHEEALARARRDITAFKADAARVGTRERADIMQAVKTIESRIAVDEIVHDSMLTTHRRRPRGTVSIHG